MYHGFSSCESWKWSDLGTSMVESITDECIFDILHPHHHVSNLSSVAIVQFVNIIIERNGMNVYNTYLDPTCVCLAGNYEP